MGVFSNYLLYLWIFEPSLLLTTLHTSNTLWSEAGCVAESRSCHQPGIHITMSKQQLSPSLSSPSLHTDWKILQFILSNLTQLENKVVRFMVIFKTWIWITSLITLVLPTVILKTTVIIWKLLHYIWSAPPKLLKWCLD